MGHGFTAVVGSILPPLVILMDFGCGCDFLINLALFICLPLIGGIVHCFACYGVGLCTGICNVLLPPLGVFFSRGCSMELLISVLLTAAGVLPGVMYANYVALVAPKMNAVNL